MSITDSNQQSAAAAITNCNRPDPIVFDDILLPKGHLCGVYIGSSGIFVLSDLCASPEALYGALRELFGTTMLRLYVVDKGLYDPAESITRLYGEEELSDLIYAWIFAEPARWDDSRMSVFRVKLLEADNRCKGPYSGDNGKTYFLRRGTVCEASSLSPTLVFYLTLFGGIFGIHRFALGEVFSGLLYLFTGGLFGIGWFLDLLSLFFGVVKDKKKRYLLPLPNKLRKLIVFPVGLLFSMFVFLLYTKSLTSITELLNTGVSGQFRYTDPGKIHAIESIIGKFGK